MKQVELSHKEHDLLVMLAEGVPWVHAVQDIGYKSRSTSVAYRLLAALEVEPQGSWEKSFEALVTEAQLRGYDHEVYLLDYQDDPDLALAELGEIPSKKLPILPRLG